MAADTATATHQAPHTAPQTPAAPPAFAAPDPRGQAQRLLMDGHRVLSQALDHLRDGSDPTNPASLVGQASDHVGSALHFMRLALRR